MGTAGVQLSPAAQMRAAITQFIPARVHVPHAGAAGVQLLLAPFPVLSVMIPSLSGWLVMAAGFVYVLFSLTAITPGCSVTI